MVEDTSETLANMFLFYPAHRAALWCAIACCESGTALPVLCTCAPACATAPTRNCVGKDAVDLRCEVFHISVVGAATPSERATNEGAPTCLQSHSFHFVLTQWPKVAWKEEVRPVCQTQQRATQSERRFQSTHASPRALGHKHS